MVFIYDLVYLDAVKDLKEKKNLFLKYPPCLLGIIFQYKQNLSEGVCNAERMWHLQENESLLGQRVYWMSWSNNHIAKEQIISLQKKIYP